VSRHFADTLQQALSILIEPDVVIDNREVFYLHRQQDGQDIIVHGSATLVQTLMQHDLVDRYRLLVYPVIVGKGIRLFQEGTAATLKRSWREGRKKRRQMRNR